MSIRASLHGRLGADPKPITTRTGTPMTRASLAVSVEAANAAQDETEWVTVLAFGRLAEVLARHSKGDMVAASGRFERNRWVGKNGEERTAWQLMADDMHSARTVPPGSGRRTNGGQASQPCRQPELNDPL